jgi:RNA-binding protein Musashi
MTFEDANAVNLVVSREHELDGKIIDPKRAIPREEHLRNTRYFVGGLSPVTTPDSMRQFFAEYGKVVDATVMLDRESGRSKGFGFVTFEDASNANQLVGNVGLILDDKQIEVKAAQPRSQRDQGRTPPSHPNSFELVEQTTSAALNFAPTVHQLPLSMLYQQMQLPLGVLNMNPMVGMGMNGFVIGQGMPTTLNMMGTGLDMNSSFSNMGNMGAMRLGHGPIGGMGAGNFIGGGGSAVVGTRSSNHQHAGRTIGGSTSGPTRTTIRGQHSFHPYAR